MFTILLVNIMRTVTIHFNPLTVRPLDTSTMNVKYPRHVTQTLIFIIFNRLKA